MVYDGIIISIVLGLIRGGSLKSFADLRLKHGWIFIVLLAVQIVMFIFQSRWDWLSYASNYFYMAVYVVGLYFLWINRSHTGFPWIFAGVLLNFIVMAANGGRMPVSPEAASVLDPFFTQALQEGVYGKHQLITDSTRLGFLGDIIPLSSPYPRTQVISVGDVVMNIGIFVFIQHLMLADKMKKSSLKSIEE
ncbi:MULTISPECIES: DUF5317 domain-containing protein [unclassified Paenibacillus]|uniref:DUF5317 domain-containing protein n=1 Tax=unclassified Paenibacillus TaxID=185978 RepID=UPI001C10C120|nr:MULTISPECIES: DUF5317 domain-containing protein [unclassified Paenibacillus]MBU5440836.1 DUF5317 domain-containing protein [Paenibacillus sp. MSJ-34]CAH0118465.1 hypothetical protein PAE9249_00954 [Paenibacillus sp. CECT 9249]